VLVAIVLGAGMQKALGRSVALVHGLAAAAHEIARAGRVRIPHISRSDEIGQLAGALQAWQSTSAERDVTIQQAPISICQLDREGKVMIANPAFGRMLGTTSEQVIGRPFRSFLHADDLESHSAALVDLAAGRLDRVALDNRFVRADGSLVWCSSI